MKILTLDIASKTGWAFWDSSKPESSIEHGAVQFEGKTQWQKTESMRRQVPKLLKKYGPDIIVIERPLTFIPQFKKKSDDLAGEVETTTINAHTIMMLNHLAGAAQMITLGFNIPYVEVPPRTWQSVIPKRIDGKPKERVKRFCDMLGIAGGNQDSRDAAVMAVWAKGHCQELKLMERAA